MRGAAACAKLGRMTTVVIADDHAVVRSGLRLLLDAADGLEVVAEAGDVPTALPGGSTAMVEGLYRGWDELRTVPSGTQSVGSTTGRSFSGTGTAPCSSQWMIGIGVPQ